jgi:hypothetical protein
MIFRLWNVTSPRSVLVESHANLVCLFNSVNVHRLESIWRVAFQKTIIRVDLSEEIVPVENVGSKVVDLIPGIITKQTVVVCLKVIEVVVAIILLECVQKIFRYEIEVVDYRRVRRRDIDIPVCSSVSNKESLEINFRLSTVGMNNFLLNRLMNLPREIGYIDSTVALP